MLGGVRRIAGAVALLALATLGVLYLAPSDDYLFVPDDARPLAPKVDVPGERPQRDGGGIYYVAIDVRQASLLESYFPSLHEGSTLVPEDEVRRPGQSEDERRRASLQEMRRSQRIAAAVALKAIGRDVTIRATGVLVTGVAADAPASGKLQPGDRIVGVDGRRVRTTAELSPLIRGRRPGERVRIRVRRDGKSCDFSLKTIADPRSPKEAIVGSAVDQAAHVRLPIDIRIDLGSVGGPSAGLAFALDIAEELGRDVDRGRKIAATGEIMLDGSVRGVGGVKQKTIGARRAGMDVFLVPGENGEEARRHADGLRVVPVKSFRQALRALATLPDDA